ncbi:polysaccharide biosynthesis tyrosine autokinase [Endozoicomonas acroporae]|uniref:polysaccharide biosynthesis tyrosine autokinase n=1 Tax=Endozoicomonas acroporae TaxID=1701104 RepID=UPI003D7A92E8
MNNVQTPTNPAQGSGDIISLSEIFAILLGGKWIITAVTAVAGILALIYCYLATPIYQADALLQIENKSSVLGGLQNLATGMEEEPSSTAEIELIRSRMVLGKAVETLKLDIVATPDYFPEIGPAIARRFVPTAKEPFNTGYTSIGADYAWGGEKIKVDRFDLPAHRIGQAFTLVKEDHNNFALYQGEQKILSGQVGESAESPNGQLSLFVAQLEARPGTRFTLAKLDINQAIRQLSGRLTIVEKGRDTGILQMMITGPDKAGNQKALNEVARAYLRQNVARKSQEAESSLAFLEMQLPVVKAELTEAENNLNSYRLRNQSVDLTMETQSLLGQIVELETRISQLELERKQLLMNYTEKHPVLKGLDEQKTFLQAQLAQLNKSSQNLPETQVDMMRLTRNVEVSTEVYTQMLNRLHELKVVKAGTVGTVRIIDYAVSSPDAIAPRKALIMVLALLMGGILSSGFVFLRALMNPGVKTPEEIENKLGMAVYAAVPHSEQLDILERNYRKGLSDKGFLLTRAAPADLAVESLRSLRTNLAFALMEATNNRIMITGPSPGVGKSFVAANLAELLAEAGKKVLLIEADLRKGHQHKIFGLPGEKGLQDMLLDPQLNAIVPAGENLDVLSGGKYPPNPSELLMSPAFTALLNKVSSQYDVVLIDTPPVLAVTDAAIIGEQCGTSFMVVRAELNPTREIDYATRRLQQAGVNVRGCVLNGMVKTSSRYGNYGYYQYSYE